MTGNRICALAITLTLLVSDTLAQQPAPAIEWQTSLGGSGGEGANSIRQTSDGGYIVAGTSSSNDGDVTGHHGSANSVDFWIVKLKSSGAIDWQKSLGGS